MPKSLEKTRKHIAKKRNGTIDALHQYSRDSRRMHRASLRDEKLGKQGSLRNKKEQPLRKTDLASIHDCEGFTLT
jgi:translation machinery-associated protein 16